MKTISNLAKGVLLAGLWIAGLSITGLSIPGLSIVGPAWAQGAPAPTQPIPVVTEASRREARALGEKLGWEAQVRGIINTLRTAIVVNIAQTNGKAPQDVLSVVDELLLPDFVNDSATLQGLIVEAWAGAFSAEELRNLRTFYNSPLGDKLLRTIPQLNNVINQSGQTWAQKIYNQSQQKHAEAFEKLGLKFAP